MPARFLLISPAPGEVIVGNQVPVKIQLPDGLILTNPDGHPTPVPGEGHLHLWLDPVEVNHDDTASVTLMDKTEHAFTDVFSGLHTISAEFFRNDHLPYEPRILAEVNFETFPETLIGTSAEPIAALKTPPGNLFIPRGGTNTIFGIIVISLVVGALWYCYRRGRKGYGD